METTTLVALMAAGGAIIACWNQLKELMARIYSLFVVEVDVQYGDLSYALSYYCFSHCKRSMFSLGKFDGFDMFVRPLKRQQVIAMEKIGGRSMLFWMGWKPLWLSIPTQEKDGKGGSLDAVTMKVRFPRGAFDVDALMLAALEGYNKAWDDLREGDRFFIRYVFGTPENSKTHQTNRQRYKVWTIKENRPLRWSHDELGPFSSKNRALDLLSLPPAAEEAVNDAKDWKKSEGWYRDRGIPWRRGWLLWGQPGTGKTSLARGLAEDLDLPVFVFDISSLSNEQLREAWNDMLRFVPCVALIEDIDNVFEGRKNLAAANRPLDGGVTFDCLLNCIDGIERTDGLFLVITTNDPEKVDPALSGRKNGVMMSRPGRVDLVIEMPPTDRMGLEKIAARIMRDCPEFSPALVEAGARDGDTAAQFQERCAKVAKKVLEMGKRGESKEAIASTVAAFSSEKVAEKEKFSYAPSVAKPENASPVGKQLVGQPSQLVIHHSDVIRPAAKGLGPAAEQWDHFKTCG